MLYAELGPAQLPLPVPVRSPRLLPGFAALPPQFAECAAIGGRTEQARPAAGSRCSCGAGGHGARAPACAGERPGAPAGGAGSDRAETPGPLLRGGRAGAGCRGSQCQRRGRRNPEGVATPGALAGAAALCIVLYQGAVLPRHFSSKCQFYRKEVITHDHPSGDHLPENFCRD